MAARTCGRGPSSARDRFPLVIDNRCGVRDGTGDRGKTSGGDAPARHRGRRRTNCDRNGASRDCPRPRRPPHPYQRDPHHPPRTRRYASVLGASRGRRRTHRHQPRKRPTPRTPRGTRRHRRHPQPHPHCRRTQRPTVHLPRHNRQDPDQNSTTPSAGPTTRNSYPSPRMRSRPSTSNQQRWPSSFNTAYWRAAACMIFQINVRLLANPPSPVTRPAHPWYSGVKVGADSCRCDRPPQW